MGTWNFSEVGIIYDVPNHTNYKHIFKYILVREETVV